MKQKEIPLTQEILVPFEGGELEINARDYLQFRGRVQKSELGKEHLKVHLLLIKEIANGGGKETPNYDMVFDLKKKQTAVLHEESLICTVATGERLVFFPASANKLDIREAMVKTA